MSMLSVKLNLTERHCVVIGGGELAARRARLLRDAGARVTVIAPRVDSSLADLDVQIERRPYREGDLRGAFLAVIATDDDAVNEAAAHEARRANVMFSGMSGDVTFPATAHLGRITITVDTEGGAPSAARAIRDELVASIDPDWQGIIEIAAVCRQAILASAILSRAERRDRIRMLTDPEAIALFKSNGAQAYRQHCELIVGTHTAEPLAKGTHD
ncbi:MAG: NAD(P)-dependent oxidoreductase [Phycisphaeraceae bacterium]